MLRMFQTNQIRQVKELEGVWDFYLSPDNSTSAKRYRLFVPGSWEMNQELCSYRGKGIYEKEIILERETNLKLDFYGVSHTADVYLDDVLVVHHYNAYTKFSAIIPHTAKGRHQPVSYTHLMETALPVKTGGPFSFDIIMHCFSFLKVPVFGGSFCLVDAMI